jgi:hypothetical protein
LIKCACGSLNFKPKTPISLSSGVIKLVSCSDCGLVRDQAEYASYDWFYGSDASLYGPSRETLESALLKGGSQDYLDFLLPFLGAPGSMIDIGCGSGFIVDGFKRAFGKLRIITWSEAL